MSRPPEPHGTRRGRGRGRATTRGSPSPSNQLRGNTQPARVEPQETPVSERQPSGIRDRKRPEVQVYVPRARRLPVEENNVEKKEVQGDGRFAPADSLHSDEKHGQKNDAGVSPRQDRRTRAGRRPRPEIQRYVPRALRQGMSAAEPSQEPSQESWDEMHSTSPEARSKLTDSPKSSSIKKLKSGMDNHCQERMENSGEISTSELGSGAAERTSHNSSGPFENISSESSGTSDLVHNIRPGIDKEVFNAESDAISVDHRERSSEAENIYQIVQTSNSLSNSVLDTRECLSESSNKVLESLSTEEDPVLEAGENMGSQKDTYSDQRAEFVSTGKDGSMESTQKEVSAVEKCDLILDVPQDVTLCETDISETQTKSKDRVFDTQMIVNSNDSCPKASERDQPGSETDVVEEHQLVSRQVGSADGSHSSQQEVSQDASNSADNMAMEVDAVQSVEEQESCSLETSKVNQKLQTALDDSKLSEDLQALKSQDDSHSMMYSPVHDSNSVSDSATDDKLDQLKQEHDVQQSVSEDPPHSMDVSEASTDGQVTTQGNDENENCRELEKQLKAQAIAAMTFENPRRSPDDEEEQEEEDSWDTMFDDNGDCLDPSLMKELTTQVGKVQIDKPKINYLSFQPKEPDIDMDAYGHVIEIYDFPSEFLTRDLIAAFKDFMSRGFDIKWVDDTHALGVFASTIAAQDALCLKNPILKVRSLSEASRQSKMKAKRNCEFLQPYKPRPETSALAARRLVSGALGLPSQIPKEKREQERKQLKEAKEKRKKDRKLKQDIWDGSVGRCAMDQ